MSPRLAVLILVAMTLCGCTQDDPPEPESGSEPSARITFDTRGGDSFAPTEHLSGRTGCGNVSLLVNGETVDVPVDVRGTGFAAEVPLPLGDNDVVAACDTEDGATRSEPVRFTQYLDESPSASIDVAVRGSTVTFDARQSRPSIFDEADITGYSWTPGGRRVAGQEQGALNTKGGRTFEGAKGERLRIRVPTKDGEYFVSLEITDAEDRTDTSITYFVVEQGRARAADLMHEHPAWVDDAVVYAPIPALWGSGGPKAVQRRLPYLKELGVDALWLWPPTSRRDAEVRRMVLEASVHWVRDIGVDGFRMGVKRRRPDFWPEWRRELKRINPDVMLLAEASAV